MEIDYNKRVAIAIVFVYTYVSNVTTNRYNLYDAYATICLRSLKRNLREII